VADHYVSDLTAAAAKAPAKKPAKPVAKPTKKPVKPAVACTSKIVWESIGGNVHLNGKTFHIKVSLSALLLRESVLSTMQFCNLTSCVCLFVCDILGSELVWRRDRPIRAKWPVGQSHHR
jgi:hypothetical protein